MHEFPHLFSSIRVGAHTLPNRAMMGSMHLGLEEHPDGATRMAAFYAERVRGGTGLIVTGGVSPDDPGALVAGGSVLNSEAHLADHRIVTDAVHEAGGVILLQILHAGRYAKHPELVAPGSKQAPINRFAPRAMSGDDVRRTIENYARAASLAQQAGYDGVEIMGSEGYLINQFLAPVTNTRDDAWGGDAIRRRAFPLAVTEAVRAQLDPSAILSFRISVADLVPGGATLDETFALADALETAGVDLFVTGIGWHEARVPTIATMVPRAAFADFTAQLRARVSVPVAATNRINTPETAEDLLATGKADLVALARPLLADPAFMRKAHSGETARINTCIGCNQACLDHIMAGYVASCLVNPRACRETELVLDTTRLARRVAVVGAGPAGLAAATAAASRGHHVTLFESRDSIGGQFDLARRIPGKEEFAETLRYFSTELARLGIEVRLACAARADDLMSFDEVVLATGVEPRIPSISGVDLPIVATYAHVLRGERPVGERVAVLGAGGIGFDVAEFLTASTPHVATDTAAFARSWGITSAPDAPGGLTDASPEPAARTVTMLQRKEAKAGAGLGLTTGWIHRAEVQRRGVRTLVGVVYNEITPSGVSITVDGETLAIEADTVVLCTGQESVNGLEADLLALGMSPHVIGGARLAGELDAKRAIREGTELAARL